VIKLSKKEAPGSNLTLPKVKNILESVGEENLDQFQRRTLDYVSKFSKVDTEAAEKLVERLVSEFGLEQEEAVQVINCMPKTVDELRVFLAGGRKIIETAKLETIVRLLEENRKLK
jgi:DNA-directed RNA polymerase subunit F